MGYHRDDLVVRASIFANRHHHGQTRLNKGNITVMYHIGEVAGLVKEAGGSDIEIAAGWLHDTVEDTSATIEKIFYFFGPAVGEVVDGLTDPPEFSGLPLVQRKALQTERIRLKSKSVKLVKIADQISNTRALLDPPEKWSHQKCLDYAEGARLIVEECKEVSEYLYGKFQEAYRLAIEAHS